MTDRPKLDGNAPSQHIARAILCLVLAYPLSGVIYWLVEIISHPLALVKSPLAAIFMLFFWIVAVPGCAGFVPADEAGVQWHNMYPLIIPTALALFFVFSKGWEWIGPKSN